jgi:hypothetical protein
MNDITVRKYCTKKIRVVAGFAALHKQQAISMGREGNPLPTTYASAGRQAGVASGPLVFEEKERCGAVQWKEV